MGQALVSLRGHDGSGSTGRSCENVPEGSGGPAQPASQQSSLPAHLSASFRETDAARAVTIKHKKIWPFFAK